MSLKKKIIENFSYLFLLKGIEVILPIVIIPYLITHIGSENLGAIFFSQSYINYFAIFINFGFDIYGTKEISLNRNSLVSLSRIISSIIWVKLILLFLSFFIIFISLVFIEKFQSVKELILLTSISLFSHVFSLHWFFQGLEKMKFISYTTLLSKILFALSIFVFIKEKHDYIYVPFFYSLSLVLGSLIGIYIATTVFNIKPVIPKIKDIIGHFKNSFQFFSSRAFAVIYTNSNSLILGFFADYHSVTIYEIIYKIYTVIKTPWDILNGVIYPHITKTKDIILLKKIIFYSFIISILVYICLFFTSDFIIEFFFKEKLSEAQKALNVILIGIIFSSIHLFLGTSTLVAFNYSKYFNLSVILSSILHIIIITLLVFLKKLTVLTVSISMVITTFFILIYRMYFVKKFSIFRISDEK